MKIFIQDKTFNVVILKLAVPLVNLSLSYLEWEKMVEVQIKSHPQTKVCIEIIFF